MGFDDNLVKRIPQTEIHITLFSLFWDFFENSTVLQNYNFSKNGIYFNNSNHKEFKGFYHENLVREVVWVEILSDKVLDLLIVFN